MSLVKFNDRNRTTLPYFNNVFDSLFNDAVKSYGVSKVPQVNISETANDYKIEFAVPGLKKEDFKIEMKKDTLFVSAEKSTENEEVQKDYTRKEFEYVSFSRSFSLPENTDVDKISAEYADGILNVVIGKKDEAKDKHKEIKVS